MGLIQFGVTSTEIADQRALLLRRAGKAATKALGFAPRLTNLFAKTRQSVG